MGLSNISVYAIWGFLNAVGSPAAVRGPQWAFQLGNISDVQGELTLALKTLQANTQEGHAVEQCLAQNHFVRLQSGTYLTTHFSLLNSHSYVWAEAAFNNLKNISLHHSQMEALRLNHLLYPETMEIVNAFRLKISLNIVDLSVTPAFYFVSLGYACR